MHQTGQEPSLALLLWSRSVLVLLCPHVLERAQLWPQGCSLQPCSSHPRLQSPVACC